MKSLEIVTRNGQIVRQNYFSVADNGYFERMLNYYGGRQDLVGFAYDQYCETSTVLYAFRAEFRDGDDVMVATMQLFSDDAKVLLREIKLS